MTTLANVVLVVLFSAECVFSANILYLANIATPSHHIWHRVLAQALNGRGHNITYICPGEDKMVPKENFTHITLEGVYEKLHAEIFADNFLVEMTPFGSIFAVNKWCMNQCSSSLKSKGLKTLLSYPPDFKFDLIVADVGCCSCLYPLIQRFNYPPTVGVVPFLLPAYVSYSFGNNLDVTHIPWHSLAYSSPMSFFERVWNTLYTSYDIYNKFGRTFTSEHELGKEIFGNNIPPMEAFERHISIILSNIDPLLGYPRSLPPNIIPVGGLHAREPKNIPEEFLEILDNAKDGAIVFSLGTNFPSDRLDNKTQVALIEAFSKLPQTVIWKYQSNLDILPSNVVARKWLPQNDLLAHPNVKLFIGHGGALSTQETLIHGIPIIAIPLFLDQHTNTKMIISKKVGLAVDFRSTSSQYFLSKIREVLENPVYARNAKNIATLFKDRLESPLERAVFWTEYVLRHGGAQFLSPETRDMSFMAFFGIDVALFLAAILVTTLALVVSILKCVVRQLPASKKVKVN